MNVENTPKMPEAPVMGTPIPPDVGKKSKEPARVMPMQSIGDRILAIKNLGDLENVKSMIVGATGASPKTKRRWMTLLEKKSQECMVRKDERPV